MVGYYSEKDAARCVNEMLEAVKVTLQRTVNSQSLY